MNPAPVPFLSLPQANISRPQQLSSGHNACAPRRSKLLLFLLHEIHGKGLVFSAGIRNTIIYTQPIVCILNPLHTPSTIQSKIGQHHSKDCRKYESIHPQDPKDVDRFDHASGLPDNYDHERIFFQEYNLDIIHTPGKKKCVADALSRIPSSPAPEPIVSSVSFQHPSVPLLLKPIPILQKNDVQKGVQFKISYDASKTFNMATEDASNITR